MKDIAYRAMMDGLYARSIAQMAKPVHNVKGDPVEKTCLQAGDKVMTDKGWTDVVDIVSTPRTDVDDILNADVIGE